LLHVDGVQAAGKIPVDVKALGVDLYSISGHKFYAPKGVGALYVKNGTPLRPIQFGGKHERERRPGTENVPSAVALASAAAAARADLASESPRIAALRDRLESGVLARVPDCGVNGRRASRTPNTTNIYFDGLEGEALVIALDLKGFAVSSGSACSSGAVEPSHVLLAMGLPRERARASLRFSLGRSNTEEQVDALIEAVAECTAHLRKLSPTYIASA
jgi:cysteine desulfurase